MSEASSRTPPFCAAADPNPVPAGFTPPPGACDCHAHVFGPGSQLVEHRAYTPPASSLSNYRAMLRTLGLSRAVIVQPSVYGTDNRTTLAAVAEAGPEFRCVVVVDDDACLSDLKQLHAKGARGARVNALFQSDARLDDLQKLGRNLADAGLHLQILTDVSKFKDLSAFVWSLAVPVVFDHLGHLPAALGMNDPGFQALLHLVEAGRAWVKLSGSYRMTTRDCPPYEDVAPFAQALVRANPEQLVWASDWPHPHFPGAMPNDGSLLEMLADWAPDKTIRNKILVDNPARLYGFDQPVMED
ncbi:MAG: amidohydrolase family protein [Pseudomonadota bacterium]